MDSENKDQAGVWYGKLLGMLLKTGTSSTPIDWSSSINHNEMDCERKDQTGVLHGKSGALLLKMCTLRYSNRLEYR